MSWFKVREWLRSLKLELLGCTRRNFYSIGVMPLNWALEWNRELGLTFALGPFRVDLANLMLAKGWIPARYFTVNVKTWRFGASLDCLGTPECPYMKRLILWLGPVNLRLHKFYRSDQDEALHDHPWWFVTFPLTSYKEWVPLPPGLSAKPELSGNLLSEHGDRILQDVKRFRFHYRPAEYRHAVVVDKPGYTIVLAGMKTRSWGFWQGSVFTPWKTWIKNHPIPPCADPDEVAQTRSTTVSEVTGEVD